MVKYDETTNEIQIIESFDWDYVQGRIKEAQEFYGACLEDGPVLNLRTGEVEEEDIESIQKFVEWNPEEKDIKDLMEFIADRMDEKEYYDDFFKSEPVLLDALAEWLSDNFGCDIDPADIFEDN